MAQRVKKKRKRKAGGSDPEYGGFDVKFLDTCQLERECTICHLAFKDPVQTTCGHRFCKTCIAKVISTNPRCPLDKKTIPRNQELFQDFAFLREFLNPSTVMCSNGCEWTGSYQDFVTKEHLSNCGFVVTQCASSNCKETFLKKFAERHKSECPWQVIKCIYCEDDTIIRKDKQSHEEQCIKFPVQCTKCLIKEIPRQRLKEHIDNECVKTKIKCPYLPSGCDVIVERDMMEVHVKEQVNKHLLLVQKKSTQDHQQVVETHKKEITQAREEIAKLQQDKDKQQKQLKQYHQQIAQVPQQIAQVHQKSAQSRQQIAQDHQQIAQARQQIAQIHQQIAQDHQIVETHKKEITQAREENAKLIQEREYLHKQDKRLSLFICFLWFLNLLYYSILNRKVE